MNAYQTRPLEGYIVAETDSAIGFVYAEFVSADPAPVFYIPTSKIERMDEHDTASKPIKVDLSNGRGRIMVRAGTPVTVHVCQRFMEKIEAKRLGLE